MKIAVESSTLLVPNRTGVEHYCYRLLDAAIKLDQTDTYYLVYMAFFTRPRPDLELPYPNVRHRRVGWLPGKLYNLLLRTPLGLPIDTVATIKPDVFLFPNFVRWPLAVTKKSVTVVYDTSYLDFPGGAKTAHHRRYLSWAVPRSIERSSQVIVISESTKQSLVQHYRTPADKITVITPAIDHTVYKPATPGEVKTVAAKYGITRDYILYLGTLEPRKNIVGIIRAYSALPAATRKRYQLVLAGGRGWGNDEIEAAAKTVPGDDLVRAGYIEEADIVPLYSGATVFVFPSMFEGWGMPPLEAMACGTPVITSNNSSLPEVVGEAGIMVEATDVAALTTSIQQVVSNPKLAAELRAKGLRQARRFTWGKSGQQLVDLLGHIGQR